ncbi:PRC-barrel domain-containing protein [Bradyrhizobium sp. UFLA05-153]
MKLKTIVNDKNETIGKINDFIFSKDGRIFAVLSVRDFIGAGPHLVAVPFNSLKLDESRGFIVLPGASRAALEKLPVYLYNAHTQTSSSPR